jgi:hypothetical protein
MVANIPARYAVPLDEIIQSKLLFNTAFRSALGPIQPPIQRVPGALSLGIKRPGREADHSSQSSVPKSKMHRAIPPFTQYASMAWCSVKEKHRDIFTFTLTLIP